MKRPLTGALGAPQDGGELDVRREYRDCGERTPNDIERAEEGIGPVTRYEECGAETGRFD